MRQLTFKRMDMGDRFEEFRQFDVKKTGGYCRQSGSGRVIISGRWLKA